MVLKIKQKTFWKNIQDKYMNQQPPKSRVKYFHSQIYFCILSVYDVSVETEEQ